MKAHSIDEAAKLLVKKLKVGRRSGTITPEHPIKGREIADDWNKRFKDNVTDVDVREWVNHARGVLGLPIYSCRSKTLSGYAWCTSEDEWKRTKAHILSAIKLQMAAATKPDLYWTHINQEGMFDYGTHNSGNGDTGGRGEVGGSANTGSPALDALLEEGGATLVQGDEEGLPLENRMD